MMGRYLLLAILFGITFAIVIGWGTPIGKYLTNQYTQLYQKLDEKLNGETK